MKKLFFIFAIMLGFAFGANAQSDQCKIEGGNGAYVSAWVSEQHQFGSTSGPSRVDVTIMCSDANLKGNVIVEVKYYDNNGKFKTKTFTGKYASGSEETTNTFSLAEHASELVDIHVYGATCTSARKRWDN